ncbi:nucleotidyltransferase domain-containing protein [bacterium]|nr:nucleotidyltransferase domain-containing protein [FCB group bacterium]MBL7191007.1 nucleotidyltransferase domain-containing protein [bacterium]
MDKKDVLEIIDRFRLNLEKQGISVDKVLLYGSYARGNYHEGSDIDLLVVSKDFQNKDFWERIDIIVNALMTELSPIEAYPMTPEEYENGDSMIALFAREGEEVG